MELKKTVFMVMPFSDGVVGSVYDNVVKPVCEELGFEVVRADEITSTQVIYDDIVQSINNATIIIVDISGRNPNVMYELGMAHVLNKPATIMLTHDDVKESPFDIRHFRMIPYKNTIGSGKHLEEQLRKTIEKIRNDFHVFFKQEFEFFISVLESVGKKGELVTFLGLKNFQHVVHVRDAFCSCGSDVSHSESFSRGMSIGNSLFPFLKMQLVEVNNNIISVTEKGRAFGDMLEEAGYKCNDFRVGSDASADPMAEFINPNSKTTQ